MGWTARRDRLYAQSGTHEIGFFVLYHCAELGHLPVIAAPYAPSSAPKEDGDTMATGASCGNRRNA